jgi:hypothetical protein
MEEGLHITVECSDFSNCKFFLQFLVCDPYAKLLHKYFSFSAVDVVVSYFRV